MSNQKFAVFFGSMAIVIGCAFQSGHTARLAEQRASLLQIEVNVLNDELSDIAWQISQKPTYADGVRDGVENSKNSNWVDGYHRGISQTLEQAKISEAISKSEE